MTNSTVIHPDYIRLVERKVDGWLIKTSQMFYKRIPVSIDFQDFELLYGISKQQVILELFRINGGKPGYYLANLRDKKYYYCGSDSEDVRTTLLSLGIGRADPLEK